jgi:UDP-N-acetylmuramyl pentapeptide phosphotransferase/UDP-N-acetylglucosamine-1-phosphate transferase
MESSSWMNLALGTVAMIIAELGYFKIADRFNIIDKPNERSSHVHHTIRGGGVIFAFGALLWFFQSGLQWPWFVLAVVIIAVISFFDDVTSLHAGVRFLVHLASMLLIIYQLWPLPWSVYLLIMAIIFCIGTFNAFNFMDGINGITGVYALVALLTFGYINQYVVAFTDLSFVLWIAAAVIVFLFFNFRKVAACFAGDVGSVTMALILVFLMLQLIRSTGNFLWPLLFLVYGTDSIITIIYRLRRKENIFKAHRTHLFQYLSNEMQIPHLAVSIGYGVIQGLINIIVIACLKNSNYPLAIVIAVIFVVLYFFVRGKVLRKIRMKAS